MISKVHIIRKYNLGDYNALELMVEATNELENPKGGTDLFMEAGKALAEAKIKFIPQKVTTVSEIKK